MNPVLSIVTGTRNRPDDLRRLIDSIEMHTPMSWELLVADASDVSIEEQPIATEEAWKHIKVLPERPRLGYAQGYNRILKRAKGQWVMFTNDDAGFEYGYAEAAIRFMEANPQIGLGAIPYVEPTGRRFLYEVNSYLGMIYANFGIIERAIGNKIGWFDEEFPMYGSDNTLAFRVLLSGRGIAEIPGARVFHYATDDSHRRENNNEAERLKDAENLINKYGPRLPEMREVYERCGGSLGKNDQTPSWAGQLSR